MMECDKSYKTGELVSIGSSFPLGYFSFTRSASTLSIPLWRWKASANDWIKSNGRAVAVRKRALFLIPRLGQILFCICQD